MIDYGISTALFKGHAPDDVIAAIAEAGFREIEISAGGEDYDAWFRDPGGRRRALQRAGITPTSVHSPEDGWHSAARDPLVRQRCVEIVIDCFHRAAEIGAEMVVVHPNSALDPFTADTYTDSWGRTLETLAVWAEQAEAIGVTMLLENMPARGLPRPGSSVSDVLAMIDGLGDHVGICLDVGHTHANGLDPTAEMREAGDRLLEVHLQDNDGSGEDQHWIMGAGTIDWDAYHETVDDLVFEGFQVFETLYGDTPTALLDQLAGIRRRWTISRRDAPRG